METTPVGNEKFIIYEDQLRIITEFQVIMGDAPLEISEVTENHQVTQL